jgi:hypothetical protein
MSTYSLTDIEKPALAKPGAGGGIKGILYLALQDDTDLSNFPARAVDQVTIATNFPLKANKYIHRVYATDKTIEVVEKKLKGPNKDAGGNEISVKGFHPGVEAAIQEFKAKHADSSFFMFIKVRVSGDWRTYLIGEPYNPVTLDDYETKFGKDASEGKGTDLTFLCQQTLPMAIYTGDLDELTDQGSSSW